MKRCIFFIGIMALTMSAFSKQPTEIIRYPNLLSFAGGVYNVCRSSKKSGLVQLEYKGTEFFGKRIFKIRPFVAAMVNFDADVWVGGGVNFDIYIGSPLVLTLGFGPGLYGHGHGRNLGYPLEMRSSVELAYRFPSHARLGAQFYHLSNGSLSPRNPGTEVLTVFYAIPVGSKKVKGKSKK